MKFRLFFLVLLPGLLLCVSGGVRGQSPDLREELSFVRYLMARGDLDEATYLLERLAEQSDALSPHMADSVSYLRGWALYQQKELIPSASFLLAVSGESPFYLKTRFFGAYNLAHEGRYREASAVLEVLDFESSAMADGMRNFQLAGLDLLMGDLASFSDRAGRFDEASHLYIEEAGRMLDYRDALAGAPARSPFVAGFLSAVVPGLGKVYAGKMAEGIAGFLYVAAMGATTYDFYRGSGSGSALFLLSATATGIFYLGNIRGSATAVRRQQNEFRHEMDQRILFDMHIPLRNAFN